MGHISVIRKKDRFPDRGVGRPNIWPNVGTVFPPLAQRWPDLHCRLTSMALFHPLLANDVTGAFSRTHDHRLFLLITVTYNKYRYLRIIGGMCHCYLSNGLLVLWCAFYQSVHGSCCIPSVLVYNENMPVYMDLQRQNRKKGNPCVHSIRCAPEIHHNLAL